MGRARPAILMHVFKPIPVSVLTLTEEIQLWYVYYAFQKVLVWHALHGTSLSVL